MDQDRIDHDLTQKIEEEKEQSQSEQPKEQERPKQRAEIEAPKRAQRKY
jgi:hypothetical protein